MHCIDAFPPRYDDYKDDKEPAKLRLQTPMRELKDRFQRKALLRAFLRKSIFNGGEVQYLTVMRQGVFCVYWCDDVVSAMAGAFIVENSVARSAGQFDDQKVLFKHDERNVGELEMRNSGSNHYGEVLFNMNRVPCLALLDEAGFESVAWSDQIILYGRARNKFGQW